MALPGALRAFYAHLLSLALYVSNLRWNLGYISGIFKGAFKCKTCGKIYIPVDGVEKKMQEYENKVKEI